MEIPGIEKGHGTYVSGFSRLFKAREADKKRITSILSREPEAVRVARNFLFPKRDREENVKNRMLCRGS
ncbi:MAG: hypothetical protein J7M18_06405 [Candidatus Eremiobacteraeota bacterium]|nr:hypothetical protein [Candidatus Eremiobacteraeota bacterium]